MINREKVYTYVGQYFGNLQQSTNGWFSCDCPVCNGKNKLAINFNYLIAKCWRGCVNGFLIDIIKDYNGITTLEAHELIDSMEPTTLRIPAIVNRADRNSKIKLPKGYHSILDGNGSLAVRAREYLQSRNFDLNYLDRIGVGYCDEEDENPKESYLGYIIIPFKRDGCLVYYIGRTFIDDFNRYKNPAKELCNVGKSEVIFNEEALYIEPKVYITEGWSCAATIGKKGVSQQGSSPSLIQRNNILRSPVKELVIVPDAEFYMQGLQAARYFIEHKKVKVVNMDQFKLDGLGKDINEVGLENLLNQEEKTNWLDQKFLYQQLKVYA